MASTASALLCALIGLVLWTGVGWLFALRLPFPAALRWPLAPALGWAAQTTIALALSQLTGFSSLGIVGAALLPSAAALLPATPQPLGRAETTPLPPWVYAAAAVLALAPAAAVLPKFTAHGVQLAAPVFDHAKIALIDAILRGGVPPINPFYNPPASPAGVSYYYLWQFGAAELARLAGASGWEADAAGTWFTAFSSLCLMCGLAVALAHRRMAAVFVLVAAAAGSLRPGLALVFGRDHVNQALDRASGFGGWLFQSSWSPHHVAAAGATVIAALLMAKLRARPAPLTAVALSLMLAAGFESSLWVGGVTFALAGGVIGAALLCMPVPASRWLFAAAGAAAALGAAALSADLLIEQWHAAAIRGGGALVAIDPYHVLGPWLPAPWRRVADLPAYWLVLLNLEFPLVAMAGLAMLARTMSTPAPNLDTRLETTALAALALVSLCGGGLLRSTIGGNNDLGWRAVLPGLLILMIFAAAAAAGWLARRTLPALMALALLAAAALPGTIKIMAENFNGDASPAAASFAEAPVMWAALRANTPPQARVANNPALFGDLLPWTVNISWALLADRPSCFAGKELALAFAPLTAQQRQTIDDRFTRLFAGTGSDDDVKLLATVYGCQAVLVTVQDGAWRHDKFAASPFYRLAANRPDRWRIYVSTPKSMAWGSFK